MANNIIEKLAVKYNRALFESANDRLTEYGSFLKLSVPYLLDEYFSFWMNPAAGHIVNVNEPSRSYNSLHEILEDISKGHHFLNRYYSSVGAERPESYFADHHIVEEIRNKKLTDKIVAGSVKKLFQSIRAVCESGWDFTSRFSTLFIDEISANKYRELQKQNPLKPIVTPVELFLSLDSLNVIPVDLNSILYKVETVLLELISDYKKVSDQCWNFENKQLLNRVIKNGCQLVDCENSQPTDFLFNYVYILREQRRCAMNKFLFDSKSNLWVDFYLKTMKPSSVYSLASFFPYWAKVVLDPPPENLLRKALATQLAATEFNTGQQWDFPSVWPPLVQIAIEASDFSEWSFKYAVIPANTCAPQFTFTAMKLFLTSVLLNLSNSLNCDSDNNFAEKYHATELGQIGGGGEYAIQFGFGWTSGVCVELFSRFNQIKTTVNPFPECSELIRLFNKVESIISQYLKNQRS